MTYYVKYKPTVNDRWYTFTKCESIEVALKVAQEVANISNSETRIWVR